VYEETAEDGNRKKLLAVGAAVGVLVLLVAAFFLMKGGGSDETFAPIKRGTPATTTDGKGTTADKPVTLPKTYKGAVGRDPFEPRYTEPVAPTAPDTTGTTDVPGTPISVVNPPVVSVPPTTTGGEPTTTTGGGTTTEPSLAGYAPVWVGLVNVHGTQSATFVVGYSNGKRTKTVRFDDIAAPTDNLRSTFGKVFALLSIQDGTATLQFGDGEPFDLKAGYANRHFVG
jgi:hypothetical protein